MKALTIRQPWAQLIALGVKTIETRSWRAPKALIGQTIAIHAGLAKPESDWPKSITDYTMWLDEFGERFLQRYWYTDEQTPGADVWPLGYEDWPLPLGAIVATATLADCLPMVDIDARGGYEPSQLLICPSGLFRSDRDSRNADYDITAQLPYGDYRPGNWAWLLTDVQPTTKRCPACMGADEQVFTQPGMGETIHARLYCDECDATGSSPPIPAKGKQGLWEWSA